MGQTAGQAAGKATGALKVVVIGAGMGGLCAAIRLAAAGQSVTLIEAQPGPGGKMRALPSPAGPLDAGPTVLTLRRVFDELFAAAGERLDDHLTLIPQPTLARHWWTDGSRLDLFCDPDQSAAAIAALAGTRAEAEFWRFNRLSSKLFRAFDAPVMQSARPRLSGIGLNALVSPAIWSALGPRCSLARHLARTFSDPRLRQLFGRYATYVGGAPDLSPAVLSLIWQAEAQGVWAVKGGMHQLARALSDLAGRVGVSLRYGVTAVKIVRKSGRATEVVLSDTRSLKCDAVVFNGDPAALLAGLLGNGPQQALPPAAAHPRSLSAWVWSFAATPAGADLIHHNVFFASDPAREFGPIAKGRMPDEATLYLCAQDRSQGPPAGPERFEIIMNAPARATLSPHEVSECRAKTFPQLAKFGLTFDQAPPDRALMTPHGFAALFPGSQGAIYGRSPQGPFATFQRPGARTRLPGLYLAGGGAHPGAGVPMAALSGKHAAEAILSDLTSAPTLARMAMRGGMSMVSRLTGSAR
ncbi:phytoene desaturase [bacterium]|nr:phytoene desaturase [bacterium]